MGRKSTFAALAAFALAVCARAETYVYDLAREDGVITAPASVSVDDIFDISFPDGVAFSLEVVSAPPAGITGQSFIAKDRFSGAAAVLKPLAGGIRITIDDFTNARNFNLRIKDGVATYSACDTSDAPTDSCATCGEALSPTEPAPSQATPSKALTAKLRLADAGTFPRAAQKSIVDILVAFDQGAKAKCVELGFDGMDDFADYAVGKMNTVLVNSQLDHLFTYRLVGVVEIDGAWKEINGALLGSLRAREGSFSRLSQLREKCGADTITLLIDKTEGTTSGIAYGYYLSGGFDVPSKFDSMNYACNVCDINTVHSRYTMSHETGHNMGCGHSNRQGTNSGPGRYSDSCGYHFTDNNNVRRGTVMAYTYTGDDDNYYNPAPYFSTPDISPAEYGCALGVAGVNDNRRTLTLTHADIASLREHVLPYDWDVRFVDDSGRDIPDGAYFPSYYYVTMTNDNPNATIYYTYDDSMPTASSASCSPGTRFTMSGSRTVTACAVVNGVAQSVRTIHFVAGLNWSGTANGNGLWLKNDSSVRPWSGEYFGNGDAVMFGDLAGVACATVTVKGAVAPGSVAFSACETAYTFDGGDDGAKITIPDANFAPAGDVTFNAPVQLSATTFTNMTGCALAFNAPFGQSVDSSGGTFTGMVNIGPYGTLTVAPGVGKTQTLEKLNNVGWYAGTSTFRVGKGTVVFNGAINGGTGVIGRTRLEVGTGGALVFNMGGGTGFAMNNTSLTVEQGGTVTFNQMEHLCRALYLNGGTIYAKRFDLMSNPGIFVTDDSSIANAGGGYVQIRNSDSEVNVSAGKTLTLNLGTQTDNSDTSGWGIIKRGGGTLVANEELKHSGVTDIEGGSLEVGYSSGSTVYGLGWIVADGATLKVKSGCSLKVPTLALDSGATLVLPATTTAPLAVTAAVGLDGVNLVLEGAGALSEGASYPVLSSSGGLSGVAGVKTDGMPALASGLGWTMEEENGTLYAKVVAAGEKPTVDVLVAFDNGAQAYVANKGLTLEAFAQTQIGKMNDVLVTNRLDRYYSYRLAGVCKVDGVYDNIDTAPALIAAGAGAAVSLRAARELYGADTVTLLVDVSGSTLGNSSPLTSPNDVASQHECAFSVCSIRAVDTGKQHTMIHENAHNMGCGHARAQSIINSPFPYGRGYYFRDGNVTRHTIMAYGGDNDASWYFSTSSSEFGFALGDATNDNARVLRETCGEVAKWRDGAAVALDGMALDGAVLQTSVRFPWSVDGNGVLRSFNQTTYANQCTTPLRATITGPKTLRFKHKSYFGGTSVAGNNYSHFDVLLDDSPVLAQTECTNSWTDAHVDIPDGTHEVVFVFSQRFAMNNPRDYKDGAPEADDAVWLKDLVLISTALNIPYGTSVNLSDVGSDIETIIGEGTLVCDATLPTKGYGLTSGTWMGTVAFRNFNNENAAKDFQVEKYGNAKSKVQFTNCKIPYLKNNDSTFAGTVVLDGDSALTIRDGYSNNYSVFGALEGNGTMTFLEKPKQWYVFNTATNFTGSINVQHGWYGGNVAEGRRVVFGTTASTQDLPTQSASITVKSGAEASIGSNATWYAYHGVEIAGTLIVKGAGATLNCHSDGAMGVKLTGGATLRFDSANAALSCLTNFSFSSGTVNIAFAPGVSPSDRQVLVHWPEGSPAPAGNFTFANTAFASTWELVKTPTGLAVKPKNRFDVPRTGSYIAYDSALESWLDDENFWMYEDYMTWQEFMEEEGANGYLNWQNYILGFSASDPLAKIKAKIGFDSQGNIVVSVADSIPRAPTVTGFTVEGKLLQTNDLKNWPSEGTPMNGKTITIPVEHNNRFYKVLVEIH